MAEYNNVHVDERYSDILEPNLYPDSVMIPGVTYNDDYQGDAASGLVKIYKQGSDGKVNPEKPAEDFSNESTANDLIDLRLNNAFRKSKKIYKVQANAVPYDLADKTLSVAVQDVRQGWQTGGVACLSNEGTAVADTTKLTASNIKPKILDARKTLRKKFANPDVVIASVDTYSIMLEIAGKDYTPSSNEGIMTTGRIGTWLGMTWVEGNVLESTEAKYYNHEGNLITVDLSKVDFIMYDHLTFSIVNNLEMMRIIDSEEFTGSKAQVEMNSGYRVSNAARVAVKLNGDLTPPVEPEG